MYQDNYWGQPPYPYQHQVPPMGAFGISKSTLTLVGVVATIILVLFLYKTVQENHGETMISLKDIMAALPSEA